MNRRSHLYKRHRFPPEIIQHVVWLYHRFNLSSRDIEDLMAERGVAISYERVAMSQCRHGKLHALGSEFVSTSAPVLKDLDLLNVMRQNEGTLGVATMCVGLGQGITTVIKRL